MNTLFRIFKLIFLLPLLFFCSCSDDTGRTNPNVTANQFTLNYNIDEIETRVKANQSEKEIKDVYISFYTNDSDEKWVASTKGELIPESYSITFSLPDKLIEGEAYKTLIVGNIDKYLNESSFFDYINKHKEKNLSEFRFEVTAIAKNNDRIVTPLPYAGVLKGVNNEETLFICPGKSNNNITNASIKFTRSVSRIDFINKVPNELEVKWVKVANYRNQGLVFHSTMAMGDIIPGDSEQEPSESTPGYLKVKPAVELNGELQQFVKGGLYTFSNMVANTLPNDKETTCLLIGGYFQGSDKLSFYRINISEQNRVQLLRRNHAYSVTVIKVRGEGDETEHEAMNNSNPQIDVEVGDEWETDGGNLIVDGDGNYLNVSKVYLITNSQEGDTGIINVSVKKGTEWDVRPIGTAADEYFEINRLNDKSFQVVTKKANHDPKSRYAQIEVFVKGKEDLVQEVILVQMTSLDDTPILTVDDQTGVIDVEVPSGGKQYVFKVNTGNNEIGWSASYEGDEDFIEHSKVTGGEANLQVLINRNTTELKRQGVLTIKRDEGKVPNVLLRFSQVEEVEEDIFHTLPPLPAGEVIIEGFHPATEDEIDVDDEVYFTDDLKLPSVSFEDLTGLFPFRNKYNKAISYEGYELVLNKAEHNTKYEFIVSGAEFNPNNELVLTEHLTTAEHLATDVNYTNKHNSRSMLRLQPGSAKFNICYYSTGPGDKDIVGKIKIKAVPKKDYENLPSQSKEINIRIKTSAVLGDPIIGKGDYKFMVADRNHGTYPKSVVKTPLNYNNSLDNHPDHNGNKDNGSNSSNSESANENFIGTLTELSGYNDDDDKANTYLLEACQEFAKLNYNEKEEDLNRWTLFSISEPMIRQSSKIQIIHSGQSETPKKILGKHLRFSKGRMFVYSTERDENNNFVGTYLPHHNLPHSENTIIDYLFYVDKNKKVNVSRLNFDWYSPNESKHVTIKTASEDINSMPKAMIRCMKYLGDWPDQTTK